MMNSLRRLEFNPLLENSLVEALVVAAFGVFYFSYALTHFDHNDFLYSASAHSPGKLYRDVHYNQAPLGFYFWRVVASLSPDGFSYPIFRIVSAALGFFGIIFAAYQFLPSRPMRLVFFALAASSSMLLAAGGEIATYTLATFLMVLGYGALFARMSAPLRYGLCALAIGLATSSKLNHSLLMLPPLIWMYAERHEINLRRVLAAFAAGALVGLSPSLLEFLQAPKAFLLHNLTFHSTFTITALNGGILGAAKTIPPILTTFANEQAVACVLAVVAVVWGAARRDRLSVFLLFSVIAGIAMALLPIRSFPQYFAPAALLIFLFYCRVGIGLERAHRVGYLLPVLVIGFIGIVQNTRSVAYQTVYTYTGIQPSISQILKINGALRAFRRSHELCDDRIFSLEGALVGDSGFRLSRNMELGPFWEELAGYIPDRYFDDPGYQIDRALIAPADWSVDAGIRFWVVGYYPNHATEIRLRQLADKRGYTTQALPGFGKTKTSLIFDPACVSPRVGS